MAATEPAARATLPGEPTARIRIPKQSGRAFTLERGQALQVIDVDGQQVADLVTLSFPDRAERFSTDQTRDVARTLYLTTGHALYALSGAPLLTIVADDVGRHDM